MNAFNDESIFGWGTTYKTASDRKYYFTYRAVLAGGVTKDWIKNTTSRFGTALERFTTLVDQPG